MPGFEVRSEGFDEWIDSERNRIRTMAVDAHYRLTSILAHAGEWEAVIETAGRTLALDILREDAHRLLMRAYAHTGQRTLALQQFRSLTVILETELQVVRAGRVVGEPVEAAAALRLVAVQDEHPPTGARHGTPVEVGQASV